MENVKQSAMKAADDGRLAALVRNTRWAAMATMDEKEPYVSWGAYVTDDDFSGFYLHLSKLAKHTRNLLSNGQVSLALSEQDSGEGDPQLLARLTLNGQIELLDRDSEAYQVNKERYIARYPDAEMLFDFADFSLFRFVPASGRYVEGFASSHRITPERLVAVSAL